MVRLFRLRFWIKWHILLPNKKIKAYLNGQCLSKFCKVIRIISWRNKLVCTPLQTNDCVLAIMLLLVDIVFEKKKKKKKAHVDIADDKSKSSISEPSTAKNFTATSVCLVRRCCMFMSVALTHIRHQCDQSSSLNFEHPIYPNVLKIWHFIRYMQKIESLSDVNVYF